MNDDLEVQHLAIPDVMLVTPPRFRDFRGFFSETFSAARFSTLGINEVFVQDNQSLSHAVGTIRGLHCQVAPNPQGKLVRVVRGAIWDVAVDVRRGSSSYGQYVAAELTAENWAQLWIPPGFLHGFCTLRPDTEVIYKVTAPYDPEAERGVTWNDPTLALPWPVAEDAAVLSDKDREMHGFSDVRSWFDV